MPLILFSNNIITTLSAGIGSGDSTINVTDATGMPSPSGGNYFKFTMVNSSGEIEIGHCTSRSGNALTVSRGEEGTTARAYSAGDELRLGVTKGAVEAFAQVDSPVQFEKVTVKPASGDAIFAAESAGADQNIQLLPKGAGKTRAESHFSAESIDLDNGLNSVLANNLTFVSSVASEAITVAFKTLAGTDPAAADKVQVGFRKIPITSGGYATVSLAAALSLSVVKGATLGAALSETLDVHVYALNSAGTMKLALMTGRPVDDGRLVTTVLLDATSDSKEILYSDAVYTDVAVHYVGSFTIKHDATTLGDWTNSPTVLTIGKPNPLNQSKDMIAAHRAPANALWFGDGYDGDVDHTTTTSIVGREYHCKRFNIDSGVTIDLSSGNHIIIRATEEIVIDGSLDLSGAGAAGAAGVDGLAAGKHGTDGTSPGGAGGGGGETSANGGNGGNTEYANGGVNNGENGESADPTDPDTRITYYSDLTRGYGAGGGSGAASTTSGSGDGGDGGGSITLIAPKVSIGAAGVVNANGKDAGSGYGTILKGGSGGGGGGTVRTYAYEFDNQGTISANGGLHSNGIDTPIRDGGDGGDGTVINVNL